MKTPKFRAYVKPVTNWDNTITPGYLTKVHSLHMGTDKAIISNDFFGGNRSIQFDEIKLDQWTGLLDKHGTEIYENDIVRTKYGRECRVVYFTSPSHNGFDLAPLEAIHDRADEYDLWFIENLEIIGNAYTWKDKN